MDAGIDDVGIEVVTSARLDDVHRGVHPERGPIGPVGDHGLDDVGDRDDSCADAGLITKEKVGRWVNCTVVPERLGQLRDVLTS